jgi:hypothetical protein
VQRDEVDVRAGMLEVFFVAQNAGLEPAPDHRRRERCRGAPHLAK